MLILHSLAVFALIFQPLLRRLLRRLFCPLWPFGFNRAQNILCSLSDLHRAPSERVVSIAQSK